MGCNIPKTDKKRVVIVGGGFGGLKLAQKLTNSNFQVVLVDKNNYHQFPPLIYQVASSGIEPSSIAFPFRRLFQKRKDFYFRLAQVRGILSGEKAIETSIGKISYDYLVLAAGTTTNFFGNKEIEEASIPMKTLSESMGLRNAILDNLERALTCTSAKERQELLNVVIVGGGATGVEIAGALSEMKNFVLPKDYPDLPNSLMNIYLIESQPRLLAAMSEKSSANVLKYLRSMGVNVLLNQRVTDYKDHTAYINDGSTIATRTFIWVTGVAAQKVDKIPTESIGRGGRILVNEYNQVQGLEDVYCIGDQCLMPNADPAWENGHPQLAQVAIQQGKLLASNLIRLDKGKELKPFRYKNLGTMATVGRNKAVAEFAGIKMGGFFAWLMWLVVHLRSILGVRNKFIVFFNWMINYFSYGQSLRLIIYAKKAKVVIEREQQKEELENQ